MAMTLCSHCRLPVNRSAHRCPNCTAVVEPRTTRNLSLAAAALAATLALLTRRRA